MLSFRELLISFRKLDLGPVPVIAHASLSAFGRVQGGAQTLVGALLAAFPGLMMPAFTYKTMITPKTGPPDNAITYGRRQDANRMAEFYRPDMPVDPLLGVTAETLRQHPRARRSVHPIYSFAGVDLEEALAAQSLSAPFGPIRALHEAGGYVLLLGVDHSANTSIHYAEKAAGRAQFIRWALTPQGILECPGWPGCSHGFNQINPHLSPYIREQRAGGGLVRAFPIWAIVDTVEALIAKDPLALCCDRHDCERCKATRRRHSEAGT